MPTENARLSRSARLSGEFAVLPDDAHLTPTDLAALDIAAVATLASWRCRGLGPQYVLLGGGVRYRVRDVKAWIAGGGVKGALHRHPKAAA